MKRQLTSRQYALYVTFRQFLRDKGYTPSQRELARELGCTLTAVQQLLAQLERKGYVAHTPGIRHSLRLLKRRGGPLPFGQSKEAVWVAASAARGEAA